MDVHPLFHFVLLRFVSFASYLVESIIGRIIQVLVVILFCLFSCQALCFHQTSDGFVVFLLVGNLLQRSNEQARFGNRAGGGEDGPCRKRRRRCNRKGSRYGEPKSGRLHHHHPRCLCVWVVFEYSSVCVWSLRVRRVPLTFSKEECLTDTIRSTRTLLRTYIPEQ